jgi:hypothetical protein
MSMINIILALETSNKNMKVHSIKSLIKTLQFSLKLKNSLKNKNDDDLTELVNIALLEKGILYKVLQILAPEKLQDIPLQGTSSKVIPKEVVISIIERELNTPFDSIFMDISSPLHIASIGQVHKATLKSPIAGIQTIAIKIQFPDVHNTVLSQLDFLKILSFSSGMTKMNRWKIDLKSHLQQIEKKLREELDYTFELQNIKRASSKGITTPHVFSELSTSKIISQEWIEGEQLRDVLKTWSFEAKKRVANILAEDFLSQLFKFDFYQADTNFSNFLFKSNSVYWLDFGNWNNVSKELKNSLFSLIFQTIHDRDINYLGHLDKLGFNVQKMQFFKQLIPNLIPLIFEPFLENRPYDLNLWDIEKRLNQILGDNKWWFRSSGGTEFFEIMKSFFGILKIIQLLEVNINWHSLFLKYSDNFDIPQIEKEITIFHDGPIVKSKLASKVVIVITKNSFEHVKVELPSSAFFNIEEMIPDDAKEIIKKMNININEMKNEYLNQGLIPGDFFSFEEKNDLTHILTRYSIYLV